MNTRPCAVMKQVHGKQTVDYLATFHQFGSNYDEFESGPGNYSTAIIEREDGQLMNIAVELVRFIPGED